MVKNLYNECMALEELLEESVNALGPDARDILAQIRSVALLICRALVYGCCPQTGTCYAGCT